MAASVAMGIARRITHFTPHRLMTVKKTTMNDANNGTDSIAVQTEIEQAQAMGVNGVPFFIFNRRTAVSGAHEPEALLQAMLDARKP